MHILEEARNNVARQVNNELIAAYWNIGRIIVDYEQTVPERADYGKQTLKELAKELTSEFGKGFSRSNLQNMRALYLAYPICQTVSGKFEGENYIYTNYSNIALDVIYPKSTDFNKNFI